MAKCCICGREIQGGNPELLSGAVPEPTCPMCTGKIAEIRFGEKKGDARKCIQDSVKSNPTIMPYVLDYLRDVIGIEMLEEVDPAFITSTYGFEGYRIVKYLGMTSGDCVLGAGFLTNLGAGISDLSGSESSEYTVKLAEGKSRARKELAKNAAKLCANAIVGVDYDVFTMKGLLGYSANGTAVFIEPIENNPDNQ